MTELGHLELQFLVTSTLSAVWARRPPRALRHYAVLMILFARDFRFSYKLFCTLRSPLSVPHVLRSTFFYLYLPSFSAVYVLLLFTSIAILTSFFLTWNSTSSIPEMQYFTASSGRFLYSSFGVPTLCALHRHGAFISTVVLPDPPHTLLLGPYQCTTYCAFSIRSQMPRSTVMKQIPRCNISAVSV